LFFSSVIFKADRFLLSFVSKNDQIGFATRENKIELILVKNLKLQKPNLNHNTRSMGISTIRILVVTE